MIKLFASDLDGTILYGFGPDEYCLDTLKMITDKGRYFAITTGRPLFANQAKSIGFMDYDVFYIAMNGSVIRDSSFTKIYEEAIETKVLSDLIDAFPVSHLEYTSSDKVYVQFSRQEYIDYRLRDKEDTFAKGDKLEAFMENMVFDCSKQDILKQNIIKVNGRFIEEEEQFKEVTEYCKKHCDVLNNTPYRPDWCEIQSFKSSKAQAVRELGKILGISEEETAVFGDAENDLSMLSAFENAYVPQNGTDAAKQYAKEITACCEDHGILNKMRELLEEE